MDTLSCFWHGPQLSLLELTCLRSWIRFHPVELWMYKPESLPADLAVVQIKDANEIISEGELFEFNGRADSYKLLPFADLFRFTLLHKRGGRWLDLDITLIKPISKEVLEMKYAFSSERTIQKGAYRNRGLKEIVDIGFVQVPAGSELTNYILSHVPAKITTPFDFMKIFRKGIEELKLEEYILPALAFLPLNFWDVKEAICSADIQYKSKYGVEPFNRNCLNDDNCFGIHWFRAILRKRQLDVAFAHQDSLWRYILNEL